MFGGGRVGVTLDCPTSTSSMTGVPRGRLVAASPRSSLVPIRRQSDAGHWALRTMAPDKSHLVSKLDQLLRMVPVENGVSPPPTVDDIAGTRTGSRSSSISSNRLSPQPRPLGSGPRPDSKLATSTTSDGEEEYHPSNGWRPRRHHLDKAALWERIRQEARLDAAAEPSLATFLHSVVLSHSNMEASMAFLLANKLADNMLLGSVQVMSLIQDAYRDDPALIQAAMADLQSVLDRDPACHKFSQCLLYFKGYHALQCYRVAHWLWMKGRRQLALAIQSRMSQIFAVDIHPAAVIGWGVMLDHATGIVIGETAVVGDNVSMLHHVSLGGSGTGRGVRHPHIGHGVLLGAGSTVLGPITVGAGSKVGAGSVVVSDLPEHCVAVGVPAQIVRRDIRKEPVKEMDQCTDFILDYVI